MGHITKDFEQICQDAKARALELIDRSKDALKSCKNVTVAAQCDEAINKVVIVSDLCLGLCLKTIDYSNEHIKECATDDCKQACDRLIYAAKECIKACGQVEMDCEDNLKSCNDSIKDCIAKCQNFVSTCDASLKILNKD